MSGPWEDYAAAAPSAATNRRATSATKAPEPGPWEDYEPSQRAGGDPAPAPQAVQAPPKKDRSITETAGDLLAGAVRGAGSIGATLLYPIDKGMDAYYGDRDRGSTGKAPETRNEERRRKMTEALATLGADTDSGAYAVGKVGAEIAGTAGAGGVVANTARAVLPAAVAARAAPLLAAVETGGASAGGVRGLAGLGTRAAGGAVAGAAAAGLTDPNQVGTGAATGAAVPVALKAAGRAASALASGVRPADDLAALARKAMKQYGIPLGIADISASGAVKAARSVLNDVPLVGRVGDTQKAATQAAFNKAVGTTFGAPEAKLTPEVLAKARGRIGQEFDRIWSGNAVVVDPDLVGNMARLQQQAAKLPANEGASLAREVDDLFTKMADDGTGALMIDGGVANKFQSYLRRRAEGTPGLRNELSDLRRSLVQAFNRSVSPADAEALRATQAQYRALKTVEPVLNSAEVGVAGRTAGDVPAALLSGAVLKGYGSAAGTPLGELAQIGSHFIADRVSRTGGSTRALVQNSAVGGALGMGAFSNPAAAVFAVPAAAGLNAALGSPAIARATLGPGLQSGSVGSLVRRAAPVVAAEAVSTETRPPIAAEVAPTEARPPLSTFGGGGSPERPAPAKTVNGVPVSRFWGD